MFSIAGIELTEQAIWVNEDDWDPVQQIQTRTLMGSLIIENLFTEADGRPMTIELSWLTRAQVDQLEALRDQTPALMPVVLVDGRTFDCLWDRDGKKPIEYTPVVLRNNYNVAQSYFDVSLKLIIVEGDVV